MSLVFPTCVLLLFIRASTEYAVGESSLLIEWGGAQRQIFTSTLEMLATLHEDAGEDEPMLPLAQMGLMMVDWLDPQKTVLVVPSSSDISD
jgi:hypothetical protein